MLGLLLCGVSSISLARDVRMHGANGDGGSDACNQPAPTASAGKRTAPAGRGNKAKAPAAPQGGSDADAGRTPRWHSFLPGMFR